MLCIDNEEGTDVHAVARSWALPKILDYHRCF
jgi:hypothetical protein